MKLAAQKKHMKILALDTSHSACSLALLTEDGIQTSHHHAPMQQAQLVLPLLHELMRANKIKLNDLDALAFGRGPGSFTGVRIAASVMQGLAYAVDLPLISISSLAATAQAAFHDLGWKKLMVGTDARIQEVYWGVYALNTAGLVELIGNESVCAPNLITFPAGNDWYAVGNAWNEYKDSMLQRLTFSPLGVDADRIPRADAVALLAKEKYLNHEWNKSVAEAVPIYLRDNVAIKGK
jgi:tRNA threonylcarbamoyladenosine biosynthesis protein TsaB